MNRVKSFVSVAVQLISRTKEEFIGTTFIPLKNLTTWLLELFVTLKELYPRKIFSW
jgi:hypothetical protein